MNLNFIIIIYILTIINIKNFKPSNNIIFNAYVIVIPNNKYYKIIP